MPNNKVLTDEQRSTLESLARTSTPYEQEVLRSILAAHPVQPVADDAAVRGDELAKRKAFTAVFLDVTTDEAREIVNHPKWSAGSWSHALDDRDAARAELARAAFSQANPGQPEPRAEVTNPTSTVGRLLATAPHFEECKTPEPSLSALIHRYYENYFERDKARECAARYIEALYRAGEAP